MLEGLHQRLPQTNKQARFKEMTDSNIQHLNCLLAPTWKAIIAFSFQCRKKLIHWVPWIKEHRRIQAFTWSGDWGIYQVLDTWPVITLLFPNLTDWQRFDNLWVVCGGVIFMERLKEDYWLNKHSTGPSHDPVCLHAGGDEHYVTFGEEGGSKWPDVYKSFLAYLISNSSYLSTHVTTCSADSRPWGEGKVNILQILE